MSNQLLPQHASLEFFMTLSEVLAMKYWVYSGSQPFMVCGPFLETLNTSGPLLSKNIF